MNNTCDLCISSKFIQRQNRLKQNGMECYEMGWHEMGWDGMEQNEMEWCGVESHSFELNRILILLNMLLPRY